MPSALDIIRSCRKKRLDELTAGDVLVSISYADDHCCIPSTYIYTSVNHNDYRYSEALNNKRQINYMMTVDSFMSSKALIAALIVSVAYSPIKWPMIRLMLFFKEELLTIDCDIEHCLSTNICFHVL